MADSQKMTKQVVIFDFDYAHLVINWVKIMLFQWLRFLWKHTYEII